MKKTTNFVLTSSRGSRDTDEYCDPIDAAHVAAWTDAVSLLSQKTYRAKSGVVKVSADWGPMLRCAEEHARTDLLLKEKRWLIQS